MMNGIRKKLTAKLEITPNQLNSTFRAMCRTRSSKPELLLAIIQSWRRHLDFTGFQRPRQSPERIIDGSSGPIQHCKGWHPASVSLLVLTATLSLHVWVKAPPSPAGG
jgi:hypothetical protein